MVDYYSSSAKKIFSNDGLSVGKFSSDFKILRNDVSLDTVCDLLSLQGVAGEKNLIKKMTCAIINKSNVGLEGQTGSGKTYIADKLVNLLTNVYELNQTSSSATFYDSKKINSSDFLYVPELQKILSGTSRSILEVIKDISEGKVSTRIRTNNSRNGVEKQEIGKDLSIIYTLANENDFKPDKELQRRFIRFETTNSKEHIKEILNFKALQRVALPIKTLEEETLKSRVKQHFASCLENKYEIIDPFSRGVFNQFLDKNQAITKATQYSSLVDGLVKFNQNSHLEYILDNKKYLIVNLEDHVEMTSLMDENVDIDLDLLEDAKKSIKSLSPDLFDEWLAKQII